MNDQNEPWIENKICKECGGEFPASHFKVMSIVIAMKYCEACYQKLTEQRERHDRNERESEFRQICPSEFHVTDIHDKRINGKAIEEVLKWKLGSKGLLIHGPTRTGKTRAVWMLLREQFNRRNGFIWMTAADFCERSSDAAGKGESSEFTDSLLLPSILFIDDVGKGRMTERNAGAFFNVLDKRFNNRKPVIMTMNMSGAELEKRFDGDMAKPLLSRIQEFCDTIQF